jgi:hypothetical protein
LQLSQDETGPGRHVVGGVGGGGGGVGGDVGAAGVGGAVWVAIPDVEFVSGRSEEVLGLREHPVELTVNAWHAPLVYVLHNAQQWAKSVTVL